VSAGLPVKSAPQNGAAPVIFESLEVVSVDPRLNSLRLARWDRSEEPYDPFVTGTASGKPWRKTEDMELSVGQPAVLVQAAPAGLIGPEVVSDARAVEIESLDAETGAVTISGPGASAGLEGGGHWLRGYSELRAGVKKVHRPRLNGPGLVRIDREHSLVPGDLVAWQSAGTWTFDVVVAAAGDALRLTRSTALPLGALYRATPVAQVMRTKAPVKLEFRAPLTLLAAAYRDGGGVLHALGLASFRVGTAEEAGYYVLVPDIGVATLHIVTAGTQEIGRPVSVTDPPHTYTFDGSPAGLVSGDWVVAEYGAGAASVRRAARIVRIEMKEGSFRLVLEDTAQAFSEGVPEDVLRVLIRSLRRVEAVLDEPVFRELRLEELFGAELGTRSASVVQGVGVLGASSYSARLGRGGVHSLRELAELEPERSVAGVPEVLLREFRTRAELLLRFAREVAPVRALLGARIADIVAMERGTSAPDEPPESALERVYAPFKHVLRPAGYDRNRLPVGNSPYALASNELPSALKAGRLVLVERETADGFEGAREALVTELVDGKLGLAPPLAPSEGFTLGNLVVRANVVRAGHGEAKAERLLGSGDAAKLHQVFVMNVEGVSFVADSTMPAGVRADIAVIVAGQTWQQTASLRDSGPADPHYTVGLTEEGFLTIEFGDGENGRRLPTGANNVRVRYRVGNGLAGNLAVGSLAKLAKPHALLAAVRQPLPATGGNDLESVTSLRENAPSSLLALERAVSLTDYGDLAASQSSLWQARAFSRATGLGRAENVEVVIVPAGGAPLDGDLLPVVSADFLVQQRDFLRRHAPPGVAVRVLPYEPVIVSFDVTVRAKSAEYDLPATAERVRVALWSAFDLRRRKLGQALQRSEVYRVVEDVPGVENSDCRIDLVPLVDMRDRPRRVVLQGATVQSVIPTERQVVHLDRDHSTVKVVAVEYVL
jgi:hypothetical protein